MTRPRMPWTRIGFAALVTGSLVLGAWGLALDTAAIPGRTWLDVVYHDIQLFVLGADPASTGGALSWQLQLARFLAPVTAVWAAVSAVRSLFAERLRRLRDRRTRGHAIVVGRTDAADAVAGALRAGGHDILRADDAAGLDDAGLAGAEVVYACDDDSANASVNVLTVAAVADTVRERGHGPQRLYAHVGDPELALALQARHLACPQAGVDFFTIDLLAAQCLAAAEVRDLGTAASVAVLGSGNLARALVAALAREWELVTGGRSRLSVTLVADDADRVAAGLSTRWGAVANACDLRPLTVIPDFAFDRIYVCPDDEDTALHLALSEPVLWRGGPGSLVVVLDRLAGLGKVFGASPAHVLDDLGGRLRTVMVRDLLARHRHAEPRVHEDMYDRLARAVHHVYLRNQLERGVAWESGPAMRRWEDLSEDLRESNRGWVIGLPGRLERVGGTTAPRNGGPRGGEIPTGAMLDELAVAEHDLWEEVRVALGWRHGPVRDDARKLHPGIGVPWHDLTEAEKDKDRDVIRNLPEILAEFGLELVFYDLRAAAHEPGQQLTGR
ncbi:RyR domain-containing protein [Myceligenerans crystallogenes]|uniref:Ryanodine receptor Ryr domain-containing protein n=1 Tax=Myceligenerans crystallogenes TaxID=316335 RepID=A0ABN2N7W0_9MICO